MKQVYVTGKFETQASPAIEGKEVFVSDAELEALANHEVCFAFVNGKYALVPNDPTEENKQKEYCRRIFELKKLLSESDYKAIKYAEGAISESEYMLTKAERQAWRDEINTLEGMLK
jgi:hypothetical protein